jgi:PAS domain S-box-containing protein
MKKLFESLDFKTICDNIDPLIYIANPENYQILYVNSKMKEFFKGELIGEKCYKIFQNFDSPCSFCTNDKLFGENPVSPVKWEFYNKKLDKWFKIIDQRIKWENKFVRFEMAIDITSQKESEQSYKESQEQIQNILENLKDPVLLISENNRIIFANKEAKNTFGVNIVGQECFKILRKKKKACSNCPFEDLLKGQNCKLRLEKQIFDKSENLNKTFDVIVSPIHSFKGEPAILESFRDITEKQNLLREIEESEKKYRGLIENLDEAIYRMDLKTGEYMYFSPSVKEVLGYEAKKFYENPMLIEKIIHPDYVDYFYNKWEELQNGIVVPTYEYKILDENNNEKWIRQSNVGIYDEKDNLVYIEGICRDITTVKKRELREKRFKEELKEEVKKKTNKLNERVKELSSLYDISKLVSENNSNLTKTIHKIVDRIPESMQYPKITRVSIKIRNKTYQSNDFKSSIWFLKEDLVIDSEKIGKIKIHYIEPKPTIDEGPFLKEERDLIGGFKKILENYLKNFENLKALDESLQRYKSTFTKAPVGIANVSINGEFLHINNHFCDIVGYSQDEMLNLTFQEITHNDDLEKDLNYVQELLDGKRNSYSIEKRYIHKNGSIIWVVLNVTLLRDYKNDPKYFISIVKDITKSKELEKEARKNEKLFNIIANNLPNGLIHIFDKDFKYIYNAGKELKRLNLNNEELIGKSIYDILDTETAKMVSRNYKKCIEEKKPVSFEGEYGNSVYMINCVPILDNNSQVEYILVLSVNITKIKKHEEELKSLTQKLKRSNAELEQFAYVASHDLQEPLRTVKSFTQIMTNVFKEELGDLDDKYKKYINHIINGTERMKSLITDLLSYSRVSSKGGDFKLIDLNEILIAVIDSLKGRIEKTNTIIHYEKMPKAFGDPSQIFQVFQNLISNAIKFRQKEKDPKIKISAEEKDNEYLFSVSDNGIGIDDKYFERIFVIFRRLHSNDKYPGSGIGLSVCKKIINRHGGKIWVESRSGEGSTFYFTLPKKNLKKI